MPKEEEQRDICTAFFSKAGIPGVVGAIDCTHIPIHFHGQRKEPVYINRRGYSSINCQMVCDHDVRFRNVLARWAGSTHHARVFNNSRLKSSLDEGLYCGVLLGDHGYPLRRYLLMPVHNPSTPSELRYNRSHKKARTHIERAFGILKQRFSCLSFGLRTSAVRASSIIVACAVLHNLVINWDEQPVPHPRHSTHTGCFDTVLIGPQQVQNREGVVFRRSIIDNHF
ncbi:putative nuclease HARBI1 [Acipenser ruthenus]|uniref:Putative nuclease HARBI1 n=1 Tax=Acipenser ruthenus TaxID=7906 RepID=A0A444TXF6_ACIRT|nr:putative nuclease HARBI1 [Acipenser ruthenus]